MISNNIAMSAHQMLFWNTPYRTGNLAMSIGDVGQMNGGVGFVMFNQNQRAPYGAILNESETIKYKFTNSKTGKVTSGSYNNKHYRWVDKAIDETIIPTLCTMYSLRREL